jgi:D-glycero-beta-D-manno-heptose-7-phosphate kinase
MKKVLIIGDSCTDMFNYGKCERLSPEAPVPIFVPTRSTGNGGMASNVYENLKALGIECDIITNDIRPVKTRYVDEVSNQMLLRVDMNDEIESISINDLMSIKYHEYYAIVISDYNKGYLSEEAITYICNHHNLVFMDTKKEINNWAYGAEFIKINDREFKANSHNLTKEYNGQLIVTHGKEGASLWFNKFPIEREHEVRDLSGAGDTFLAAIVAKYVETKDINAAIQFANKCASWVVTQKGVAVVDINKIS